MNHVIHHNDPDGYCSAAVACQALAGSGPVKFTAIDYKDPRPEVARGDRVFVLDFSFKDTDMAEIRAVASEVVWIDHHASAKDYGNQDLPGLRAFEHGNSMSGAWLTHEYFHGGRAVPTAVKLVSDYDTWTHADDRSKAFFEGLKMRPEHRDPAGPLWDLLLNAPTEDQERAVTDLVRDGDVCTRYRDSYTHGLRNTFGYETQLFGHTVYALNCYGFGSAALGGELCAYPFVLAYAHDGLKFTVSMYSVRKDIDCGALCKTLGGGGHKGAAGFVCCELPFKRSVPQPHKLS